MADGYTTSWNWYEIQSKAPGKRTWRRHRVETWDFDEAYRTLLRERHSHPELKLRVVARTVTTTISDYHEVQV